MIDPPQCGVYPRGCVRFLFVFGWLLASPLGTMAADPAVLTLAAPTGLRGVALALAPVLQERTGLEVELGTTDQAELVLSRPPGDEPRPDGGVVLGFDPVVLARRPDLVPGPVWFEDAAADGFRLGRGDPDESALGIHGLLVLQLASRHYSRPDLLLDLFRPGQTMPDAVLLRRLQAGSLDVALVYRSQAIEADLPFAALPREIDLGSEKHAATYAEANLDLDGVVHRGAPIRVLARPREPGSDDAARALEALASGRPDAALEKLGLSVPESAFEAPSPRP